MKVNSLEFIEKITWDAAVFGMDTYEIHSVSAEVLQEIMRIPGHYTIKVNPLASKKLLHEYGFYYCDTLIEPYCQKDNFNFLPSENISISRDTNIDQLLPICHSAFEHGRFHRDFNLKKELADLRYDNWLRQLQKLGWVYSLSYLEKIAGFIAFKDNKLVLHALAEEFRGRGLAKFFWSKVCKELFNNFDELTSSISASNLSALNLYASLGFRFRNSVDIYHRIIR